MGGPVRRSRGGLRARRAGQSGYSLVEMLVVVAIMSIAIITIAVGLQTSQTATTDAYLRSRMHLALGSFRTSLSAYVAHGGWQGPFCPASVAALTTTYMNAIDSDPKIGDWKTQYAADGIDFKVTKVNYWDGGFAWGGLDSGAFKPDCTLPERYLQEVVLQVSQATINKPEIGSVVLRMRQTT